ncbi:hypothetical protein [Pseudoclavibacter sp. VKM Ac-2888]|uniref:hypothetical protein n=1 Tax=Pseudoclavibacter sp. VKM Ac-2888 TaxID=2783830 RepID=UPI00188BEBF6|nr:hypothetical protein [Pseudoclavibacter sp. VKM Ac-2888]MBF4552081.1 hypothetical protein [Pseudoclavibacter sp. VKM Ac-2888]
MSDTSVDHEVENRQVTPADGFWDAYQRSTMPREAIAICGVVVIISTGIATAISTFF